MKAGDSVHGRLNRESILILLSLAALRAMPLPGPWDRIETLERRNAS